MTEVLISIPKTICNTVPSVITGNTFPDEFYGLATKCFSCGAIINACASFPNNECPCCGSGDDDPEPDYYDLDDWYDYESTDDGAVDETEYLDRQSPDEQIEEDEHIPSEFKQYVMFHDLMGPSLYDELIESQSKELYDFYLDHLERFQTFKPEEDD